MNQEIRKLRQSFGYAVSGLRACLRSERNFRIHVTAAVYVSAFAGLGRLGMVRFAILCLCFALMLSAELMNTALERLCDRQSAGYDRLVKQVKDIAAAAVLVCAAFCAVIGMVFFVPSGALWCAVQTLAAYPWAAGILVLSVPAAVWFVFCFGRPQ